MPKVSAKGGLGLVWTAKQSLFMIRDGEAKTLKIRYQSKSKDWTKNKTLYGTRSSETDSTL